MSTILILLSLSLAIANVNFCNGSFGKGCHASEREALLTFKQDLRDDANQLASWTNHDEDYCGWVGVVCDNVTGHVLGLHLGNRQPFVDDDYYYATYPDFFNNSPDELEAIDLPMLRGKINPSLLELKHLSYLDLSNNAFGGIPIPCFLGSIESLRYLDLSSAGFGGLVPNQLGNLSRLQYLSLYADYENNLYVANLQWLSSLSLLKHLDLGLVNLGKASNWLQVINRLPSLQRLYLSNCQLPQVIPPPTNLNLSSLAILDLSENSYKNPLVDLRWIFNPNTLVSIDLSKNNLEGYVLDGLKNMTSLRHLDLSSNSFNSSIPGWLYNLPSLQFLYLTSNNLKGEISSAIGNLTSAIRIDFSGNSELEGGIPSSMGNLCNLKSIDFSGVNLSQNISDILEIFSRCVSKQLVSLTLRSCQLYGQLTNRLGNLKNLKELNLINNSISGPIQMSIVELSSLRVLRLGFNNLKGQLPESIGQLANLEVFGIFGNLLDGVVSKIHFTNLTKLKILSASRNMLILKLNPDWVPPFQLKILGLGNWDVGSQFPTWLRSQKYLEYLEMSNSMISDSIPSWLWNSISQFQYFNLSHNQIHGQIPNLTRISYDDCTIDLSFNGFNGPLPHISSNITFLDLSHNSLSGSLFPLLCFNLNGTMGLVVLSLGNNFLSGEIPDCWMKWQYVKFIRLDNNFFTGRIPSSVGSLNSLQALQLRKNNLFGEIPLSLKNGTNLVFLDFGENEFYGNISRWLVQGHSLLKLKFLILRSNKFSGYIPDQLCTFTSLQILDLGNNNLSGSLPRCIGNFTAMVRKIDSTSLICLHYGVCFSLLMMMKGQMLEYTTNLNLVRNVDVSNNKLSGEIPMEVTSLSQLQSLNLSHNHLTGRIPESVGVMRSLESVDFSVNKLFGSIPQSMSNLTFLNHLNFSCNNLIGEIPSSTQLQSFDPSSYGNNQLCGLPLPQKCSHANGTIIPNTGDEGGESDNRFEIFWFCLGIPFGFVVGFWSVVGPFLIKRYSCCGF